MEWKEGGIDCNPRSTPRFPRRSKPARLPQFLSFPLPFLFPSPVPRRLSWSSLAVRYFLVRLFQNSNRQQHGFRGAGHL